MSCRSFVFSLVFMLAACTSPPPTNSEKAKSPVRSPDELQLFARLKNDLPGFYSNYAQIAQSDGDIDTVIDLIIRELISSGDPVFLFESQQRKSAIQQYDLYWSQINPQSRQLELQFARLSGSELSTSMPETLGLAKQRALPGCVISLRHTGTMLAGSTNAETCQYQNPAHGKSYLYRFVGTDGKALELANMELAPGELEYAGTTPLHFQKHQSYQGKISISPDVIPKLDFSDQWQSSTTFTLSDDGRALQMLDADMKPMDYTVRLSKLKWRENEPPYLKLDVIQAKSGEVQAYSWFRPELEQITFERDWVRVNLKKTGLE